MVPGYYVIFEIGAKKHTSYIYDYSFILISVWTFAVIIACLSVLTLAGLFFFAENFMSGLKVVFDRERKVLGWKFFNCKHLYIHLDGFYRLNLQKPETRAMHLHVVVVIPGYSVDNSSNLPVNPNPSGVPPKPALGPNSYTPEATKGASPNGTQVNVLQPSASFSLKLHCNRNVFVAAALLFLVIL
jgi:hypothetical protein